MTCNSQATAMNQIQGRKVGTTSEKRSVYMFASIKDLCWWIDFTTWIAGTAINTATMFGIIAGTRLIADIVLGICDPDVDCEVIE